MDLNKSRGNRCDYTVNAIMWSSITFRVALICAHGHGSCGLPCLIMPLRKESLKVSKILVLSRSGMPPNVVDNPAH